MTRKGELSKGMIDTRFPHQVAVEASKTIGATYIEAMAFCRDLSLSPRGHSFRRDDRDYVVWCFAVLADAEAFRAQFGGEIIAVKDRPKWGNGR